MARASYSGTAELGPRRCGVFTAPHATHPVNAISDLVPLSKLDIILFDELYVANFAKCLHLRNCLRIDN